LTAIPERRPQQSLPVGVAFDERVRRFRQDHPRRSGLRVGGHEVELPKIAAEPIEEHLLAVGPPADDVQVLISPRPDVDRHDALRQRVDDRELQLLDGAARNRVQIHHDLLGRVEPVYQRLPPHVPAIQPVCRETGRVRRPLGADRTNEQAAAYDPLLLLLPVRGELAEPSVLRRSQPDVVIPVERHPSAVRRRHLHDRKAEFTGIDPLRRRAIALFGGRARNQPRGITGEIERHEAVFDLELHDPVGDPGELFERKPAIRKAVPERRLDRGPKPADLEERGLRVSTEIDPIDDRAVRGVIGIPEAPAVVRPGRANYPAPHERGEVLELGIPRFERRIRLLRERCRREERR
jgi:hypothetical protein